MRASSIVRWSLVLVAGSAACLSIDDRKIVDGPASNAGAAGDSDAGRAGLGRAGNTSAGDAGDAGEGGAAAGSNNGGTAGVELGGTGGTGAVSGGVLAGAGGAPNPLCGNGTMNPGELCDDGNAKAADGCTSCMIDKGFACTGTPSTCVATCGDGIVASTEACDDGGKVAGNGCSATCTLEAGYGCWGEPSVCSRSCAGIAATACQTESCCERTTITGGTVRVGRGDETCSTCTAGCPVATCVDQDSGQDTPEHNASVNQFLLDKYEVTVGRFRRFADAYAGPPAAGAGAHPAIVNTGWQTAWNSSIAASSSALKTAVQCSGTTWTNSAGANEQLPMNCVSWYEAFAFCAWDGGRVPTENEWEFAAAGGSENRVYPWGNTPLTATQAVYNCPAGCTNGFINIGTVGSKPAGAGRFGNRDLVGNVKEWVFDYYAIYSTNLCSNCATTVANNSYPYRVIRGGGWRDTTAKTLRSADRFVSELFVPTLRNDNIGFRCARTP